MTKLSTVYNSAKTIPFDDRSKFIIMSDTHKSDGGKSDDFIKNNKLYKFALNDYFNNHFTYIELGDGEELWECRKINKIIDTHIDVYLLLKKFHDNNRLYFIYGNHDKAKKNQKYLEDNLYKYYDNTSQTNKNLFNNLKTYNAIRLKYNNNKNDIFLLHGHQVDFFNDNLWWLARFLSKQFWRRLEYLGVQDPTRASKSYKKKLIVERKLIKWISDNNQMIIAGHTHKPEFSNTQLPPYFNTGSCVSNNFITGIEIVNGTISLVKWHYTMDNVNEKRIIKQVLYGPCDLHEYLG